MKGWRFNCPGGLELTSVVVLGPWVQGISTPFRIIFSMLDISRISKIRTVISENIPTELQQDFLMKKYSAGISAV